MVSNSIIPLILTGVSLPIFVLSGFGIYAIFKYGYKLEFIVTISVLAVIFYLPRLYFKRKKQKITPNQVEFKDVKSFVDPSNDWSDQELAIWRCMNIDIGNMLSTSSEWADLKLHCRSLIELTAKKFDRAEIEFSVPEALKMSEELSRRYRIILKEHVPLVESIKISHLKFIFDKKDSIVYGKEALVPAFGIASKAWRLYRATDPILAVFSEIKSKITSDLFTNVNENIQASIKKALLQEVVSVSIDLYSGRFAVDDENLSSSKISIDDEKRKAKEIEPLRVVICGQVKSGTASLVNTLTKRVSAEVSILPSHNEVKTHSCQIDGVGALNLVQLPGLSGDKKEIAKYLEEITQADMVIWVLKSNRSAKELDKQFWKAFDDFYQDRKNIHSKKPISVGILNQVDLLKPTSDWSPPYNLDNPIDAKAITINKALEYNGSIFNFSDLIPLSISEGKPSYNIEKVEQLIEQHYEKSIQTQLNRRRLEGRGNKIPDQFERLWTSGKTLFKAAVSDK
jgi:predicted GTPase/uncharacterized membrane protein